ncbi:retinol dehydrogenase 7 [Linepithema humile]|uniref:retinol dehydrogenase 7 n=1 Tax=Linepithema humile TaxID=83485 RepID=UPI0006234547|nr:PREDICTED: retinol dehydrogenase 7 isoform X2 [Linepithema humile]
MNSVEKVYGYKLAAWYRRHSLALHVGTMSFGLGYFMTAGAPNNLWSISLGSAVLGYYVGYKPRSNFTTKDLIVISGCNCGLGYSLALHCRAQGATVLAGVHNLLQNQNAAVVEEFKKKDILFCDLEITDEESVYAFAQTVEELIKKKHLVLRALVNNAGVMVFGEFEWQTSQLMEYQIDVNVLGTMRLTRAMMPMIRQNGSRIIIVSSHCAQEPLPGISVYGASKAAEYAWATSLRVELGKYGVKVVCFIPGGFVSESNIMKRQKKHFQEMKTYMSEEANQFYSNYFTKYAEYLSHVSPNSNELKIITNSRIYETFNDALLEIYPSEFYRCESWRYFFYRILFKITPMRMRDWLVMRFVNMPAWQPASKTEKVNK